MVPVHEVHLTDQAMELAGEASRRQSIPEFLVNVSYMRIPQEMGALAQENTETLRRQAHCYVYLHKPSSGHQSQVLCPHAAAW